DDYWSANNSAVVCRQLGFSGGRSYTHGNGVGPIQLDDVECNPEAHDYLWQCAHAGWGSHDCNHGEDVGIICDGVKGPFAALAKRCKSSWMNRERSAWQQHSRKAAGEGGAGAGAAGSDAELRHADDFGDMDYAECKMIWRRHRRQIACLSADLQ
ncbi:Macrophage receptor MARCO, partial [Tetrabaena socialis]